MTLAFLLAATWTTAAQEVADSFEQLGSRVRVGDRVVVTDTAGREIDGTIAALSASALGLAVNGTRLDFDEADVDRVSRRDSRWNGTVWGLGAGGVLGALLDRSLVEEYGREDISSGASVSFIATAGGIGAGIGFAVDAMIKGRRVIYSRAGTSMRRNATVLPMWAPWRRGIFVSLRF